MKRQKIEEVLKKYSRNVNVSYEFVKEYLKLNFEKEGFVKNQRISLEFIHSMKNVEELEVFLFKTFLEQLLELNLHVQKEKYKRTKK